MMLRRTSKAAIRSLLLVTMATLLSMPALAGEDRVLDDQGRVLTVGNWFTINTELGTLRVANDLVLSYELRGADGQVLEEGMVPGTEDQTKPETFQKLVDRAKVAFGGFNCACIRTGTHVIASVLTRKEKDLDKVYQGNVKTVFHALQAVVPPLVAQKSGQVVINTSAGAMRPQPPQALYCATRAAANALVRATGLEVAPHGVTVNATGTAGMEYPSYLHMVGADKDPAKRKAAEAGFPMKRFIQPEDAASFVATLIDGTATGQSGQFFPIDAGWSVM